MLTYELLLEALQAYLDEGWQVEIFPWVVRVGVSGLLDNATIKYCLEFLETLRQCWQRIIADTAKESVKAFYSMHCVCCKALDIGPRSSGLRSTRIKAGASHAISGMTLVSL